MNEATRYIPGPPSKLLTIEQQAVLAHAGFFAAREYFNGNNKPLAKYLEDRRSQDKRTAAAGNCAARAGIFELAYLLGLTEERGIANFTPKPPRPWDLAYNAAAEGESAIWHAAVSVLAATNALRERLPGINCSEAAEPEKAPPVAPPPVAPPAKPEGPPVQKIEIVGLPAVTIAAMPAPGPLQVDVASMPSMTTETTVQRHPNSDEILKTVATTRPAKERTEAPSVD